MKSYARCLFGRPPGESNPGPSVYETDALTTELAALRTSSERNYAISRSRIRAICVLSETRRAASARNTFTGELYPQ